MTTLQQKLAQQQDQLNRTKERIRKSENGQKIVTGGMMLSIARKNPKRAQTLLEDYRNEITRKTDLERLKPIIDELEKIVEQAKQAKQAYEQPIF